MTQLFSIASQLSTPLALGGFFAAAVFLTIRQILRKDVFPKLSKSSSAEVLKLIIDRLFILALVAMILGFVGYLVPNPGGPQPTPETAPENSNKIPGDTGWIFAGHFDIERETFIEGPYVSVVGTTRRGQRRFVEIGDTVRLNVSRPVIITGFQTDGIANRLTSPLDVGAVSDLDQTGIVLPVDTELVVRDLSEGASPGNPNAALWLRVVHAPE